MPGTTHRRLEKTLHREKDFLARTRIAMGIDRKQGMSINKICENHHIAVSTGRTWLHNLHRYGLSARYDMQAPGKPSYLNRSQIVRLGRYLDAGPIKCGYRSGAWTLKLIRQLIIDKFGITYAARSLSRLLARIKFSLQTPRGKNPLGATDEEMKKFNRATRRRLLRLVKKGFTIISEDEMSCILHDKVTRTWARTGCRPVIPITLASGERVHMFGALTKDQFFLMYSDKVGTEYFLEFIDYVYSMVGKFVMVLDNASYHKSRRVREYIKEKYGDRVKLIFLPPYTPELSPIEPQWTHIHKHTRNVYYESAEELKKAINEMLATGEIPIVEMYSYMLV